MPSEGEKWYTTYAWRSCFPFREMLCDGLGGSPLALFEPDAIQLMDRAITWLECYFEHKGYTKIPRPRGTRAELFLLLSHFQIVHTMLVDSGPTDVRLSRPVMDVARLFQTACPPPPENVDAVMADAYVPPSTASQAETREAFRRAVLSEPLPYALDWNPIYVDGSVFRQMRQTLSEDHEVYEQSARRFQKAASSAAGARSF
jgi:hypothetical protein